jgi:hypothetical protein
MKIGYISLPTINEAIGCVEFLLSLSFFEWYLRLFVSGVFSDLTKSGSEPNFLAVTT